MNRRSLLKSFALALFAGAISTATPAMAGPASGTKPAEPVLRVGKSHRYYEDLRITLVKVKYDHRCPINAQCISAGDAKVILRVKVAGKRAREYALHTDHKPNVLVIPAHAGKQDEISIPKSYVISIKNLLPVPYAGKKTPQRAFRLKLKVDIAI